MENTESSGGAGLPALTSVPDPIRVRAAKALASLVGNHFPELVARSRVAGEERAAREAYKQALREAGARRASTATSGVEQVMDRIVDEAFAEQERREEIAARTIEHLSNSENSEIDNGSDVIDEDWLNLYNGYAGKASSESLQDMWSRVLSGQIRKPGSISLKTLQFVSVLDRDTAEAATRVLPWMVNSIWMFATDPASQFAYKDLETLRDSGLIGAVLIDSTTTFTFPDNGLLMLAYSKTAIAVRGTAGQKIKLQRISSSKTCSELSRIVPLQESATAIDALVEALKGQPNVASFDVGPFHRIGDRIIQPEQTLTIRWRRDEGTPA